MADTRKSLLLRIDPQLHSALQRWADDEFRSVNAQIEFLLKKAVSGRGVKWNPDSTPADDSGSAKS
jgi:hypothetical protein